MVPTMVPAHGPSGFQTLAGAIYQVFCGGRRETRTPDFFLEWEILHLGPASFGASHLGDELRNVVMDITVGPVPDDLLPVHW